MAGDEGATVHVPTALIEPATSAAPGAAAAPAIARRFLIVTAPFNAFARELAQALRAKGITVERVLLNAGDWLYWGWRDAIAYRGRVKDWEAWIGRQIRDRGVTDIITFGDTTHYASAALRAARALGVETHIFEEGYFRPNWITLERDGINALSSLPRDPAWYAAHPLASVPEPDGQIGPAVGAMVRQMSAYHIVMMLGALAFPHFRTGYQDGVFAQGVGHVFRYGGAGLAAGRNKRALARALASSGKVFLVLLQRPGDSQLRIHSPFDHVVTFIRDVMTSFASNAPPDARLLIRPHPLD
ncbi:MAG: capsular biosynthesis protein, partial [Alphaproteobacteria bacterium]|nr:capsular biosynthesis protein [Alphaproteobacteria bacterium]